MLKLLQHNNTMMRMIVMLECSSVTLAFYLELRPDSYLSLMNIQEMQRCIALSTDFTGQLGSSILCAATWKSLWRTSFTNLITNLHHKMFSTMKCLGNVDKRELRRRIRIVTIVKKGLSFVFGQYSSITMWYLLQIGCNVICSTFILKAFTVCRYIESAVKKDCLNGHTHPE